MRAATRIFQHAIELTWDNPWRGGSGDTILLGAQSSYIPQRAPNGKALVEGRLILICRHRDWNLMTGPRSSNGRHGRLN
jgi:hypothetical protein